MLRLCLWASKPFTSCNSLNTIIVWGQWSDLCRERDQGLPPHPLSLCVPDHSMQEGLGRGCSQWAAAHGPPPRPAFPFLPARAPRSIYPSGTGSSLLQAAFVCLSQNSQPTFFCFLYISEQSPSHGAQPSLTFPPLEWISTCLTTWGPTAKKDHTLGHHETKPACPPQQAGPLPQHVPWVSQPDPGTCGQLPTLCCQVIASPEGVWAWRIMGLGYQAHQNEEYVVYKLPWVIPQFVSLILLAFHSST